MKRVAPLIVLVAAALATASPARAEAPDEEPSRPAPGFQGKRGDVAIGAEHLVPIARYYDDGTKDGEGASFGWGILGRPRSVHDVPRIAIDVAVADRVTVGAAPILSVGSLGNRYAIGLAPRVGFVIPLSRRVSAWPNLGITYAFLAEYEAKGHQLAFSAEAPLVVGVAEHVAVSLGAGMGAPIVNVRGGPAGATSVRAAHVGLSMGLVAWF